MKDSSHWHGQNIVWSTCKKEAQESIDKCTGCHNTTEIMLKTVLTPYINFPDIKYKIVYSHYTFIMVLPGCYMAETTEKVLNQQIF